MSILAYWLEEYVGVKRARTAAWHVTIAAAALLVGAAHLILSGG